MDQSVITGASQIITQISDIIGNLTIKFTPAVLGAAKISAIYKMVGSAALIFLGLILTGVLIWSFCKAKYFLKTIDDDIELVGLFVFIFLVTSVLSAIFIFGNINTFIVSLYGVYHPDAYLAFQAYQKVMGN